LKPIFHTKYTSRQSPASFWAEPIGGIVLSYMPGRRSSHGSQVDSPGSTNSHAGRNYPGKGTFKFFCRWRSARQESV